jgi:hypothetical protein
MIIFNEKPVTVTIQIGKPIYGKDVHEIHQAVLAEMKNLIETNP